MSPIPNPGEMLAVADRIAGHAEATRRRAAELAAVVGAAHWRGAAADVFHAQAHLVINGLRRSADRLDDAADALRRHTYQMIHKLAQLADLASDIADLGGDILHGIGDIATHPSRLLEDGVSIFSDQAEIVGDALHLVGLK